MRRSRFTEGQIIGILREQETAQKTADVCRLHDVRGTTFYKWKFKFSGMDARSQTPRNCGAWAQSQSGGGFV